MGMDLVRRFMGDPQNFDPQNLDNLQSSKEAWRLGASHLHRQRRHVKPKIRNHGVGPRSPFHGD